MQHLTYSLHVCMACYFSAVYFLFPTKHFLLSEELFTCLYDCTCTLQIYGNSSASICSTNYNYTVVLVYGTLFFTSRSLLWTDILRKMARVVDWINRLDWLVAARKQEEKATSNVENIWSVAFLQLLSPLCYCLLTIIVTKWYR